MPLYTKPVLRIKKNKKSGIVFIRLTGNKQVSYISTGESVLKKHWKTDNTVSLSDKDAQRKNDSIIHLMSKIRKEYDRMCDDRGTYDVSWSDLKDAILNKRPTSPRTITDGYEQYYEIMKARLTNSNSLSIYRVFKEQLGAYAREEYPRGMRWEDASEDMIRGFIEFLGRGGAYKIKGGMKRSTIGSHVDTMKRFLKYAQEKMWHNNDGFRKVKFRSFRNKDFTLTYEEVMKMYALDLSGCNNMMEQVRDSFVFSYLTGARFSDVNRKKPREVSVIDIDGQSLPVWHYVSKKTKVRVTVPLIDVAHDILLKWKRKKPCSPSTINRYMKDIAKMAGLTRKVRIVTRKLHTVEEQEVEVWEGIHFHQGRSGMVTRLIKMGVPDQIVAELSGMSVQNIANYYRTDDADLLHQFKSLSGKTN